MSQVPAPNDPSDSLADHTMGRDTGAAPGDRDAATTPDAGATPDQEDNATPDDADNATPPGAGSHATTGNPGEIAEGDGGDDVVQRRRRAVIAGHRQDPVEARRLFDDDDDTVRAAALGALHRTGALTPVELTAALADPSARVRSRALEVVAALAGGGPATTVSILSLLDDPDPTVVEVGAWALGEREPTEPGSVEALTRLATDADDALIRETAVASLGSIGDPAGLKAILEGTRDKATVRRRAVIALAPFEGEEVDAALEAALTDRDWQVRQAAEDLIEPPRDDQIAADAAD